MPVTDHTILSDGAVWLADVRGDVDTAAEPAAGLYVGDARLVSTWRVSVVDRSLGVASTHTEAHRRLVVQVPASNRNEPPEVLLVREQVLGAGGLAERITVTCPRREPVAVTVRLVFAADFADQFRVRSDGRSFDMDGARTTSSTLANGVECAYVHEFDGRRFTATSNLELDPPPRAARPGEEEFAFEWDVELGPGQRTEIVATVTDGGKQPRTDFGVPPAWVPSPERLRLRNIADLDALTIAAPGDASLRVPAAGAPWFLTMFGRDSVLTAELAGEHRPQLGPDVLRALAALQGREHDPRSLEEPGRIVHEVRRSELATLGQVPYGRYYGSVDATPLFLLSLGRQVTERGDAALAQDLQDAARRAVSWILGPGGLEEHGFVVYRPDGSGLANHGWKDSWDATPFSDGTLAKGPIALAEVQGYAWEALRRTATLARHHWEDSAYADLLDAAAGDLRRRFRDSFWVERDQFPALALDGDGRQVDVLGSNAGHLLWTGMLDADEAELVADRLMSEPFFSGWGIRTLAAGQVPYSPMSYHNGSVWPHDTAMTMQGMVAYGMTSRAEELARGLMDAAEAFDGRMPELFAGWSRREVPVPVPYPHAGRPQAWAAAAGLAATRVLERATPSV